MQQRQSLVGTLDPRFGFVLIHGFINRPLSLPWVRGVKFHLFQDRRFWELFLRFSRWQHFLQSVQLGLVKGIGELDVKFDVEVAWFVVSLRGHTLTVDDLQVTWRVASVEWRWRR